MLTHHAVPGRKAHQLPVETNTADVATHTMQRRKYRFWLARCCHLHTYCHGGLNPLLAVCTVIGSHDKPAIRYQDLEHDFMMTLLCTTLSTHFGTATLYTLQLVDLGTYSVVRPSEVLFLELSMRVCTILAWPWLRVRL